MRILKITTVILNFVLLMSAGVAESQWENVSGGMGNLQVYSLLNSGNIIYAGTATNGLYISSNNGNNWTFAGLNSRIIFSLTMFSNYLYAGSDIGIWRTSNNGAYWIGPSINGNAIYSLASNQTRAFAGLHNSGLFYSPGGSNWFISSLSATNVKAIVVNGDVIFAGCGNNSGVFKSTNNGNNWVSTMLNYKSVYSLALDGNRIFAGTGSGVYYSGDNGGTWIQTSLNNEMVYALAIYGNNVFAGTELHGVFASSNNGSNWTQINEGLGNFTINSLSIINNYLFAGASVNGVYRRPLSELVGTTEPYAQSPAEYVLSQNYPNPFNPSTKINFTIPKSGNVKLIVFDNTGKTVDVPVNKMLNAGTYEVNINGASLSSGIYFYKLETEIFSQTKKMILIK